MLSTLCMKSLLTLLLTLAVLAGAHAQTGTLRGTVKDAETGQVLVGATVFIVGTYKGTYTTDGGRFVIQGIKPGDYSVKFSYVGYAEKIYRGVSISAGENERIDVELASSIQTLGEVEIVGEPTLIDLESGQSSSKIGEKELAELSVKNVQEAVALQVGVSQNPDGIQIRGSRVYETEYRVDGISAQDPLAGTGFGVDVDAGAINEIEVITGGSDAEYGSGGGGVVLTRIKEGGDQFSFNVDYRRDNLGFNLNQGPSWNTDELSGSLSGPIIKDKLTFFLSGSVFLSDNFYLANTENYFPVADQLRSSLFENDTLWAPRQDNRWSNTVKLAYQIQPGVKLTFTNQHSLNLNQSTRTLQIVGNDAVVQPGLQFRFALDMDQANTYTHHSNLSILNLRTILGERWSMDLSLGRLSTNLRADANGRPFRSETVDQIYDPRSIVTDPIDLVNPDDSAIFVFPGPGLVNNGGIAALWHDHYAEEYTIKNKFNFVTAGKVHYFTFGIEHKEQYYQWLDVTRPWVGAPLRINDTLTTVSTSLGSSSDFWEVRPSVGGLFVADEINYKGLIANLGLRFNYWAMGTFVDEAVDNPQAPVLEAVREAYRNQTSSFLGRRWKARLLPRLRVSFPVTENNVLYFNYSHNMQMPHPRFVYAGLDPVYQDRSFLSNLGNPNINPEVTVSYEVGLKSQLTKDLALSATAFYNDKFDYIVSRRVEVRDQTGRFVEKTFFINQDYARIRGIELALTRRLGNWFSGTLSGAYQIATGKSNTAAESALQVRQQGFVNTTKEQILAWDRPFDLKLLAIFTPDSTNYLWGFPLRGFRAAITATYKSGLRYTPHQQVGTIEGSERPQYEPIQNQPFARVGAPWFWIDLRLARDFFIGQRLRLSLSFEVKNLTNYLSSAIINPVTGRAWEFGDDLPVDRRDPRYPDPQDNGTPPDNPARYLAPRHLFFGVQARF